MIPAKYLDAGAHVSAWHNRTAAVNFVSKIHELLLYRFGYGSIPTFESSHERWGVFFHTLDGAGFTVGDLSYFDQNYYGLPYQFGNSFESRILDGLVQCGIIEPFSISCSDEKFREIVDNEWCEYEPGWAEEEDVSWLDENKSFINDARLAFNACEDGNYKKALEDGVFSLVAHYFADQLCIPVEFACQNMEKLVSVFFDDENYYSTYYSYSSSEVYHYRSYRDALPEDVRAVSDKMVEVFLNPLVTDIDGELYAPVTCYSDKEQKCYNLVTFYSAPEDPCEYDERDIKFFFPIAVKYVRDELPKLRKEYGNA